MHIRLRASFLLAVATAGIAVPAVAQPAIASDLWRVASATLVVPAPLAVDGSAALWTPATVVPPSGPSTRVGVEAIHSPADIGINGGVATVDIRAGSLATFNLVYGRLGIDGLVRTETSPEAIGGDIAAYAEVLSFGVARAFGRGLVLGVAARALSGRLDVASRSQWSADVGVRYTDATGLTVGFATRFFDPTLRQAEMASSYSGAVSYRTPESPMWGTRGALVFNYGVTLAHGEGAEHLLSAGLTLGGSVQLDAGAEHEAVAGTAVWRSRLGIGLGVGRYRVYLGRDGGVNGFGATYRFGLAAWML
jgi:hypothetical protein